ncbi:MAG: rRNA maturation RNase YbeY [Thioalkalivibrionaceae bacterium]
MSSAASRQRVLDTPTSDRRWILQYPSGRSGAPAPGPVHRQMSGIFVARGLDRDDLSACTNGQGGEAQPRLTVRFVDAAESAALNEAYRGRSCPTNVLSFSSGEPPLEGLTRPAYLGDLVLCVSILRAEAVEQGKGLLQHTAHLLVHGLLHLEGFDHVSDKEAEIMEDEERRVLSLLGWPDPYAVVPMNSNIGRYEA